MSAKELPQMDWQQVVLNGGPPCFHVEWPQFCGRAERWPGHGNPAFHAYVSLDDYLRQREQEARTEGWLPIETAPRDGTKVLFYTPECTEIGWLAFIAESFYDKRGELNDTHVVQWQDGMEPTHWMPRPPDPPTIRRDDTPQEGEQS